MFEKTARPCPGCGHQIIGYVDECPKCGRDKPVPMPKYYYLVGAVIAAVIVGLVVDYPRIFSYFFGG